MIPPLLTMIPVRENSEVLMKFNQIYGYMAIIYPVRSFTNIYLTINHYEPLYCIYIVYIYIYNNSD